MDLSPAPVTAAVSQGAAGPPALRDPAFYDRLLTRAVAAWFLLLSVTLVLNLSHRVSVFHESASSVGTTVTIAEFLTSFCMLLFNGLAAWLTLRRSRPLAKARGLLPRLAALAAVTMLFAVNDLPRLEHPPLWLLFLSSGMAVVGGGLTVYVLSHLGKSFSVMPQARRLVADGPYRVLRHPLYLCEEIGTIGIFLPFWSLPMVLLLVTHFAVQITRMFYEERLLRATFPEYDTYARRTPRLIPGVW